MTISAQDIVPLTTAKAQLSELAEQLKAGTETIITKNGEDYVALIDAHRLHYYYRLEQAPLNPLYLLSSPCGVQPLIEPVGEVLPVSRTKRRRSAGFDPGAA